ncbi:MAG: TetR/AcrR family transcriptional regulator [Pseudomonadota bacterium]
MPPKQGRPPKKGRRDEILKAGYAEFAAEGFHLARLDRVADRAGVAKGTIYIYFESKEQLFEAAVRARVSPILGRVIRLTEYYPGPTKFLLRMLFRLVHQRMAEGELRTIFKIMIAEGDRFPDLLEFYYTEFVSKMLEQLERIVERGVARGELRAGAATSLPIVLISPGVMGMVWSLTFERYKPLEQDALVAAHIDLVMNGVSVARDT